MQVSWTGSALQSQPSTDSHRIADLGHLCRAHLVANVENLNPANTLWTKNYRAWANVESEARRFLEFEKSPERNLVEIER